MARKELQKPMEAIEHRDDIEGLRAIAILLVVAAHADVPWLAGGFVGVDVFFVLSGYLITRLLAAEIRHTQTVQVAAFYARRFRRLLPALLLMLVVTSVLGRLLVTTDQQPQQAMAAASAAVWLSNFFFAFSNMDYFSPGAETNLFLHTWSLGVEEQFYLLWPLLLMLGFGAWTGSGNPLNRRRALALLWIVFFCSLVACIVLTAVKPPLAFYMMPTRAWQFALGGLAALRFAQPPDDAHRDREAHRWGGWAGLAAIVSAAIVLDGNARYPGAWALLPSLGAAAVLVAGCDPTRIGVGKFLSLAPMRAIGQVSYAWYLWHWPVLLLGATLAPASIATRFGLVALSFALAVISHRLVEAPIRRNPRLIAQPGYAVLAALMLMFIANATALRWHNAAKDRMEGPEQMRYLQAKADAPVIYRMGCDDWYRSADVHICAFGAKHATHTAVVIGDSIGLQWFPAIAAVFDRPDWRLLVLTKSSCPMVDEPIFYARIGRDYTECSEWRRAAVQQIAALRSDIVILGSTYTYDFHQKQWTDGTARVLRPISEASHRVYVLRSTPVLPFDGPACLAPRSWLFSSVVGAQHCVASSHNAQNDDVYGWLQVAASRFSNVSAVDMTDAVCPHGQCAAEQHGVIVFRDSQHLSATFARSLAELLAVRIGMPVESEARSRPSGPHTQRTVVE